MFGNEDSAQVNYKNKKNYILNKKEYGYNCIVRKSIKITKSNIQTT